MLITDIEANNLLEKVTQFHCGVIYDYSKDEYVSYRPWDFGAYLDALEAEVARGGLIVFHNGHKYDAPALTKLAKLQLNREFHLPRENVIDTLVLTRLLFANIKDTDMGLLRSGKLPGKRFGSHALEAWGYRLGEMKGEYKDDFKKLLEEQGEEYQPGAEWLTFNEPMMDYNVQDVVVTKKLFEKCLQQTPYFPNDDTCVMTWEGYTQIFAVRFWEVANESVWLEHRAAWLLAKQERNGFPFDTKAIERLYVNLSARRAELQDTLIKTFGTWYRPKGGTELFLHPRTGRPLPKYARVKYPKQGAIFKKPKNKAQREGLEPCELDRRDYVEGAPYTPVEYVIFNPSSRDHIQLKLQEAGWVPTEFTEKGAPKIDDEVLEHVRVEDPQKQAAIDLIKEYLMVQKRIGQAAEGDKAWLRYVQEDGKIHGSVNPNGAVTGRATHSFPNLGQVPGVRSPYGAECRAAFGAEHHLDGLTGKPWVQAGIDASGLELRCLAHFMSKYDDGAYADVILNGDIHTVNQEAAELPTRDNAKTFIYGFLYGAGDEKIGQIVGAGKERGKELKKKFLENTPAIAALREGIQSTLVESSKWVAGEQQVKWKRRWVKGLDGRRVHVRSPHAALNTVLQSSGALICKLWIIVTEEMLLAKGYKHGWDGDFAYMAWVHDEIQVACKDEAMAQIVIDTAQEAMRAVGEHFKFRCRLDTEGKMGPNWAVCH
ncbi:putative DNA polymerase [Erwinia phage pEp_SNUABM_09]|uniref:DNA-directed DNA polymerase n=1 Tax=Erwinia phage pEp_SNUABM_09 TaxID=2601644 RepID=A0A5J6DA89_9CAUD|nr:putative DNA polymerase [Erwinia phage pEp_SNUABM_09]QOC57685.1 putative DNA-directed DNA polymerase [Erwinia phage pEp_SNUABM_04]